MADIESNIDINIDTSDALVAIKNLQRQISQFHTQMAKSGDLSSGSLGRLQQNLMDSVRSTGNFTAQMKTITTSTESFTTALEKNKLSMGQYFRYAGSQVTGFRKLFSTEFDTIDKVARERVKTLQTQYIKMGRDASGAMKAIEVRPLTLDMDDLGTKTAMAAQKAQIFNQLMTQGSTNLLNFGKNTQWAGRQLMVGFTIPLGIMGAAASREFMKMEEQVIRFQRVYGDFATSVADTDAMADSIKNLASEFTKYGIAVEKTMGLAADAAAMGKQGQELLDQVTEATRLSVLGGVEQQQALETTTSMTNAFGIASDKLAGKINFLNAVENQTVTSIEDLTEAIPKAGPVVQQLGGNVEDLAFFMTAMKEGGIDAGEGANALKSGLASMINPTQEAIDLLNSFNINIEGLRDANAGNVAGMVKSLATELDGLSDLNRAQAIETMFGKFQFARMSTLFQNVIAEGSQANRVLQLTNASTAELAVLSEREMKRIEDSPMYKFKGAVEEFKMSLMPVGEAFLKAVTPIIEFGAKLLENFNGWSEEAKSFTVILTAAVAGIGPVLLMTLGLVMNGIANLIKGVLFVGNIFRKTGSSSKVLGEQLDYMTMQQLEAQAVAASLGQVHTDLIQTFTSEAGAVNQLAAAYRNAVGAQSALTGPIMTSGGGTRTTGKAKPKRYATGVVSVPGSGNGDTVPAMLTPGEAVIPKDMVKRYGPLISAMISGNIPGFKTGGFLAQAAKTDSYDAAHFSDFTATGKEILEKAKAEGAASYAKAMAVLKSEAKHLGISYKKVMDESFKVLTNEVVAQSSGINNLFGNAARQTSAPVKDLLAENKLAGPGAHMEMAKTLKRMGVADGEIQQILKSLHKEIDTGLKALGKNVSISGEKYNQVIAEAYDAVAGTNENAAVARERMKSWTGIVSRKDRKGAGRDRRSLTTSDSSDPFYATPQQRSEGYNLSSKLFGKLPWMQAKQFQFTEDMIKSANTTEAAIREGFTKLKAQDSKAATELVSKVTSGEIERSQAINSLASMLKDRNIDVAGLTDNRPGSRAKKPAAKSEEKKATTRTRKTVEDATKTQSEAILFNAEEQEIWNRADKEDKKAMTRARKKQLKAMQDGAEATVKYTEREQKALGYLAGQPMGTPQGPDDDKDKKPGLKQRLASSAGKVAAGAGAVSALAVGASMMGGPMAEMANTVMGPMMALSGVASLFTMMPPQIAAVVAALAAVVVVATSLQGAMSGAIDKAITFGNSVGSSTKSINALAEATGSVTSSQVMDKQRSESIATMEAQNVKDASFGQSYLENQGKSIVDSIIEQIKSDSSSLGQIHEQVYQQMSTAIVSGALNMDDAKSIVAALGEKLNDPTMAVSVIGKLTELMGPNGEKLSEGVFEVALDLQKQSSSDLSKTISNVEGQISTAFDGWNPWENMENLGTAAGTLATVGASAMQQQQALLDSLDLEYQKRIEIAEASGDQAKIQQVQSTYEKQRAELLKEQKNTIDTIVGPYEKITGKYGNSSDLMSYSQNDLKKISAMGEAVDKQITETYKGDPAQAALATTAKDAIVGASGLNQAQEFEMKFLLSTGDIPPQTFINLIDSFGEDSQQMTMAMDMVTNLGTADGGQALQLMNMFTNEDGTPKKDVQADFLAQMSVKTPEGAKETMDFYQQLLQNGGQEAVEMAIEVADNEPWDEARQSIENLKTEYKEIEDLTANGPVTMEMVTIFDQGDIAAMKDNADWFNSLDAVAQKYFLQHYVTIKATIDKSEVTEYLRKKYGVSKSASSNTESWTQGMIRGGTQGQFTQEQINSAAAQMAREQTQSFLDNNVVTGGGGGNSGGPSSSGGGGGGGGGAAQKEPTSFLDDIVKKLRDVRKGAQRLTETFADSWAAINGMFGNGANINVFNGLQQQMRQLGAGEDLINLIAGMSPEEFEAKKNDLFNFDANGNITGFKDMLSSIGRAMNAIALGEFQNKQKATIQTTQDQNTAIRKLIAAGYSYAEAYEMATDAAVAHAIAQETNASVINEVASAARNATEQVELLAAAQAVAQTNAEAENLSDAVGFLEQYSGALTDAQTSAILASDRLQFLVANFADLNPEQLAELSTALENADLQTEVDIRVGSLTIDGMEKLFSDGFSKAMERFAAQEKAINIRFNLVKDPFKDVIEGARDRIEDLQNAPGGLDDLDADLERIGQKEKDINDAYTKRSDALNKIESINNKLIAQQRSQLTLADALSQGDIAAAARAVQESRAQEATQAIADQREALAAARDIELARVTGMMGLTRTQIEEKIRALKLEILNIEETIIEPAQHQVALLERQEELEIKALEVLGYTRDEWEAIENQTVLAKTESDLYTAAIQLALDKVEEIVSYWEDLDGKEVSTIHTIIERRVQETTATPAPAPAPTPAPAPAPAARSVDYADMARRVYRGEYGNGQTRINNLRNEGFSDAEISEIQKTVNRVYYGYARGGMVANYLAKGGFPGMPRKGTDVVPAMLTPGEFVMTKYAVDAFGASNLKAINNGTYKNGSVYNNTYSISVNAQTDANPDQIARTVIAQIKQIDGQRIRGNRF